MGIRNFFDDYKRLFAGVAFLSFCTAIAQPVEAQEIGSRVMCSPFSMEGDWHPGTVLKKEQGAFIVRLDKREDHTDGEIYKIQTQYIKPGSGQRPANWAHISDNDRSYHGIQSEAQLQQLVAGDGLTGGGGNAGGGGAGNSGAFGGTANTGGTGNLGTATGAAISVGARVLASPFSMENQWFPATVMKAINGGKGGFVVLLDNKPGVHYGHVFQVSSNWVKPGNVGPAPAVSPPIDEVDAIKYGLQATAKQNNAGTNGGVTRTPANNTQNTNTTRNTDQVSGKGTPPSGLYQCNKISGSSYIHIGTIEIKGNTYRGFAQEGPFHPFTMDGSGGITWTAGLLGAPDGWRIGKANYAGLDHTGKPWIQIRYVSPRDAHETVDAIRE